MNSIITVFLVICMTIATIMAGGHGGHGGYGGYGHDFKLNYKITHGDYHAHQDRYKSHDPYGFQYGVYQSHPYGGKSSIQHYQNTGHH